MWYRSLNRHLPAPVLRVLHATGLGLWYLFLDFVILAYLGRMNGKRKWTGGRDRMWTPQGQRLWSVQPSS